MEEKKKRNKRQSGSCRRRCCFVMAAFTHGHHNRQTNTETIDSFERAHEKKLTKKKQNEKCERCGYGDKRAQQLLVVYLFYTRICVFGVSVCACVHWQTKYKTLLTFSI